MTPSFLAETTFADGAVMAAAILAVPVALWLVTRPPRVPAPEAAPGAEAKLLGPALVGLVLYVVAHPWGFRHLQATDPKIFYAAFAATKAGLAALGLAIAWRICRGDPVGLRVPRWRAVGWGAAVYVLIVPSVILLATLTDDGSRQSAVTDLQSADLITKISLFVYLVVVVPLFEELVFRGLIQGGLRRRASAVEAILISSILFVIVHPASFWPSIFILALLFGWVYEKARTIWAPIVVHAMHNALTFALIVTRFTELDRA